MAEPRGDLDLATEPLTVDGRRELRAQHLHGDFASVRYVFREIHHGHAAPSDLANEAITGGERNLKLFERHLRHPPAS